jgi:NADH dehydrogenase [ubiquinone] 1 alpha subcomplex assembly factor 1
MLVANGKETGACFVPKYIVMKFCVLQKSFKRDSYFDWRMYSHIVIRVRGDGRSYMLNISTMGYYDIMWNDIYSYVLFTRGGPYWQLSKVKQKGQESLSCF